VLVRFLLISPKPGCPVFRPLLACRFPLLFDERRTVSLISILPRQPSTPVPPAAHPLAPRIWPCHSVRAPFLEGFSTKWFFAAFVHPGRSPDPPLKFLPPKRLAPHLFRWLPQSSSHQMELGESTSAGSIPDLQGFFVVALHGIPTATSLTSITNMEGHILGTHLGCLSSGLSSGRQQPSLAAPLRAGRDLPLRAGHRGLDRAVAFHDAPQSIHARSHTSSLPPTRSSPAGVSYPSRPFWTGRRAQDNLFGGGALLVLALAVARQYDSPVYGIRQPAMATPDHHGADDHLAECRKLPREGSHDGGVTEREPDVGAANSSAACSW
jgi:hypothetical protein